MKTCFCKTDSGPLKISKAVKIIYYPNGNISMCENYNENSDPICILDNDLTIIKNVDISKISECNKVGIKESKKSDVLSILDYLKPQNKEFYVYYFNEYECNTNCNDFFEESEEEY
jgi:hypothetical protein